MSELATRLEPHDDERTLAELEVVVERGLQTFVDVGQALASIRDRRLYLASHFSFEAYCEERWGFTGRRGRQLIAAAEVGTIVPIANEGQARELAKLPDEQAIVDVFHDLRVEYGEQVTAERVRGLVRRRLDRVRREQNGAAATTGREVVVLPATCELIHASVEELELEPESVDLILTDPPYPRSYLPVYESLARLAASALRPGGSLVVMTGQSILFDAYRLIEPHLEYVWTLSYDMPGIAAPMWHQRIYNQWKPLLWFVKGKLDVPRDWIGDKAVSDAPDKRFHDWGQSESGMRQLVERFSRPGELVVDPFLGGGATGVAALVANRRFLGADVDEQAIDVSAGRIASLERAA